MKREIEEFLNRFDRLSDSTIQSLTMSVEEDGRAFRLTLLIDTIDDEDDYRGARIEVVLAGVFDFRLAFGANEAPFVLGHGVAHTRSEEGDYFEFWAPDFDRSVEEIKAATFYVGFRELTFEVCQSNLWGDLAG